MAGGNGKERPRAMSDKGMKGTTKGKSYGKQIDSSGKPVGSMNSGMMNKKSSMNKPGKGMNGYKK